MPDVDTIADHDCITVAHADSDQCCGSCALFAYECMDGSGICELHQEMSRCEFVCEYWIPCPTP